MQRFSLFFSIFAILIANRVSAFKLPSRSDGPYVRTPLGCIEGYYKSSHRGRKYSAFEGIPYALPPIGELRFQPPRPIAPWPKAIEAKALPPRCAAYETSVGGKFLGQEDCLHLNVYTPIMRKSSESIPVIFWIHGGGFQIGTSSTSRAKYLMDRDVILVTINYRLGVFGFLSTGDDVVPGNMGLKDQNLALRWVNENIKYFGGDPKRITITGASAGGASVHFHYLAPMSRGLFRNGISFSGSALNSWAFANDTTKTTRSLARAVNCTTISSAEMVGCLKKVSARDLILVIRKFLDQFPFSYFPFPPVAEKLNSASSAGHFIDKSPEEIIRSGEVYDAPWITGVVPEEGLFMTAEFILNRSMVEDVDDDWRFYAPYALHYSYHVSEEVYDELADVAREHYFGRRSFTSYPRNLTSLLGDKLIVAGVVKGARLHAEINENPVWFYYYTYKALQSASNSWSNSTVDLGVSHVDDIYLVLENDYLDPTLTERDEAMMEEMLDYWCSYASEGKPNLKGAAWKPLDPNCKDFEYMHIVGPKHYKMEVDNNFREVQFWNKLKF